MTILFRENELIIGSATIPENVTFRFSDILKLGGSAEPSWQDIILSGNTALTLVNAKEDGLNYLKLFGGTEQLPENYIDSVTLDGKCEQSGTPTPTVPVDIVCNNGILKVKRQSGLPLGYQMVEWLKPTGTIIITGFKTKSTQEIETVFYRERSGASYLYSSDTATSGTTNTTAYLTSGAGNWRWDGKSYSINVPTGIEVTSIQNKDGVWLNGTQSGWYSNAEDFVSTNDLRLSSGENTTVRIYSQTIREGGIATLDLVPVQRLSDSLYGFYDKVGGEFYTNTEATFVAGDVIDDPVEIYTDGTVETATDSLDNVATAEMLLSVGDYKDTQEILTGGVTRNIGIKVLDGTEDGWSKANNSFSNSQICPDKIDAKLPMLCTHFVYNIGTTTTITNLKFGCSLNGTNVYFRYDTISTVEDWQTWLADQYNAGTPVIIVYPTSSATTETVTGQFLSKEPVTVTGSLTGLVANVVSSSHTTPTPTQPLPINCNNGVLKVNNQGQIYTDGTVETVGITGKNLFDPTKVLFGYYRNATTGDKRQSAVNFMSSDDSYIPCLPNTTYTFVGTNKTNGTYSKYNTIYFFDSAKNYLGASQYEVSQPTTTTTPNNCYYLQVRSNPLDTVSVSIQDAFSQFNWQLEQGSTATEYEPYYNGGTATAEMLLKVETYQDEQNVINGHITRNVGIKVLDGAETWTKGTAASSKYYYGGDTNLDSRAENELICNQFGVGTRNIPAIGKICVRQTRNGFLITPNDQTIDTVAKFKQFLADQYANGTPVIVVYPLATPTTETVTGQHLHIQAGTNIVEITQASIDNLGLEVSYKGTV